MVQGTSSGAVAKGKLEESCDEDEGSATSNIAVGLSVNPLKPFTYFILRRKQILKEPV